MALVSFSQVLNYGSELPHLAVLKLKLERKKKNQSFAFLIHIYKSKPVPVLSKAKFKKKKCIPVTHRGRKTIPNIKNLTLLLYIK